MITPNEHTEINLFINQRKKCTTGAELAPDRSSSACWTDYPCLCRRTRSAQWLRGGVGSRGAALLRAAFPQVFVRMLVPWDVNRAGGATIPCSDVFRELLGVMSEGACFCCRTSQSLYCASGRIQSPKWGSSRWPFSNLLDFSAFFWWEGHLEKSVPWCS